MKNIIKILFVLFIAKTLYSQAQTMPCAAPPNVLNVEKPNVLIILDVTGSMRWRASATIDPDGSGNRYQYGDYSPEFTYYGYFHPDSLYRYVSNKFVAVGYNSDHSLNSTNFNPSNDTYLGNILNWGVMSRMDIAKKVLTGGRGLPTQSVDKHTLIGEGGDRGYIRVAGRWVLVWPTPSFYVNGKQYRFSKPNGNSIYFYIEKRQGGKHGEWRRIKTYRCYVDVSGVPIEYKKGVIRQIADKDNDGNWDQALTTPRFGLFFFSTSQWDLPIEFYMTEEDPDMEPFINAINNVHPNGGTPVGNAILEAIHYISYVPPHWDLYTYHGRGTKWDPMYSGHGSSLVEVPCRKNFVLIIGDGESNSDERRMYSDPHLPPGPFSRRLCDYDGDGLSYDCETYDIGDRDHPADDYAYYAHITDLRPDISGFKNNIEFYSLFAFGAGAPLFQEIAKDGGFNDINGNLIPDLVEEYDEDNDGLPDHYYEAQSGQEFEEAIRSILLEIIARVTSGTAVSIITQTSKGEGVAAFASYYPRRFFGSKEISWIGVLRGLWVDKFGFLREDFDHDLKLNLRNDYVITFYYDSLTNQTYVYRYRDVFGNGDSLEYVMNVPIENLEPLWDASQTLLNTSYMERNIWTFVDDNNNQRVDNGEYIEFTISNRNMIGSHLDLPPGITAEMLIGYVRGLDYNGYRDRTLPNGKVWKLGDIIFSTPLVVGRPAERYDLIYDDLTYNTFFQQYKDRRTVVYVGANDGMLHAFNSGVLRETDNDLEPIYVDPQGTIGEEIYAFIPFNLLPHLKWLMYTDYCHVYYVDLKPYPTDVKIFSPDITHPEGWGTVIIGGMRFGGTPYRYNSRLYSSGFFLLDVTDPERTPQLLWEMRLPDSSYTTSFPTTCKVGDSWYLVVGSGPTNLDEANSYQNAHIYVIEYATGNIVRTFTLPDNNSFIGDIIAIDKDLDYSVDELYFGTTILENPVTMRYGGKVYKIKTYEDPDPNNWQLMELFDAGEPIVAAPSVSMDPYSRIWVYFGTGRFFSENDEDYTETQYLVGFRDEDVPLTFNDLVDVTNVRVFSADSVLYGGNPISFKQLENLVTSNYGWYRRLPDVGERCITSSAIIGGSAFFTTYIPAFGPCQAGGRGKLYALYYLTGTAYFNPILGEFSSGENIYAVSTGRGMPAEPTVYIGASGERVFVQTGTGGIVGSAAEFPYEPRGKIIFWKGK